MQRTAIGNEVYKCEKGFYWIRPTIGGWRSWRKIVAADDAQAIAHGYEILHRHRMAEVSGEVSPLDRLSNEKVRDAIRAYLQVRECKIAWEKNLEAIDDWWGKMPVRSVSIPLTNEYAEWRMAKCRNGKGTRVVDMELSALAAVLSHAVRRGVIKQNPITGRTRFHAGKQTRNCRDTMPANGNVLHDVAACLLAEEKTATLGWQMLFEALTGVRTCEALAMKWDAKEGEPGYIEGERIDIRRAKSGIRPWVTITADLHEMLTAFQKWHGGRFEHWFPASNTALAKALYDLHKLGGPKVTSHGMRAYYVTKMRRDGLSDSDVATLIGDKSVSLIHSTYGQPRPGEPELSFRRSDGTAAWDPWLSEPENVVQFPTTLATIAPRATLADASPSLSNTASTT